MGRRKAPPGVQAAARAETRAAVLAWAAHLRLCYQCHAAGGRPGLFCDAGFAIAQDVTRTRAAAAAAGSCPDQAQGTLL